MNKNMISRISAIVSVLFIFLIAASCTKKSDNSPSVGKWVFWTDKALYSSHITLTINATTTGNIAALSSSIPACGDANCYTIDLSTLGVTSSSHTQTIAYTAIDSASATNVRHWSGSIVVTPDNYTHCNTTLLTYP